MTTTQTPVIYREVPAAAVRTVHTGEEDPGDRYRNHVGMAFLCCFLGIPGIGSLIVWLIVR
jgi:hypothetical protein